MNTTNRYTKSVLCLLLATTLQGQNKAYLTHGSGNLVTVIDTAANAVLRTIPVDAGPVKVAMSKDGSRAYVVNATAATVSVIDTDSDTVVSTIPVGASPSAIAVTPNGASACWNRLS